MFEVLPTQAILWLVCNTAVLQLDALGQDDGVVLSLKNSHWSGKEMGKVAIHV